MASINERTFTFKTLKDFRKRLKELGLPSSRGTILSWIEKGYVTFSRSPGNWIIFKDMDEIDSKIKEIQNKRGEKIDIVPGPSDPFKLRK